MFIQRTNCRCILLPMLVLIVSASVGAESGGVVSTKDPATGLLSWKYEGDGLGIELLQVPPDFIRT